MNQTALITGASNGIGLELAKLLAQDSIDLVLTARSEDKLEQLQQELTNEYNVKVYIIKCDLSEIDSAKTLYEEVKNLGLNIDILINNAGFGDFGRFTETDWGKEQQMIQLNMTSLTQLTKLISKDMIKTSGGKIMNVASTAAFQAGPLMAVYYATKAYVLYFSEAIAHELKDNNITVTCLCPGPTESGFQAATGNEKSKLVKGKKLPTSKEVAKYGYKAMKKGKVVAIHGTLNYVMVNASRFLPRNIVTDIVYKAQIEAN
ncbi:MAG: SDR family oxidoreductase [Bacteroidia bacterium]|nr:SDR family oxidoreductase [Bacteroidia bacterium]